MGRRFPRLRHFKNFRRAILPNLIILTSGCGHDACVKGVGFMVKICSIFLLLVFMGILEATTEVSAGGPSRRDLLRKATCEGAIAVSFNEIKPSLSFPQTEQSSSSLAFWTYPKKLKKGDPASPHLENVHREFIERLRRSAISKTSWGKTFLQFIEELHPHEILSGIESVASSGGFADFVRLVDSRALKARDVTAHLSDLIWVHLAAQPPEYFTNSLDLSFLNNGIAAELTARLRATQSGPIASLESDVQPLLKEEILNFLSEAAGQGVSWIELFRIDAEAVEAGVRFRDGFEKLLNDVKLVPLVIKSLKAQDQKFGDVIADDIKASANGRAAKSLIRPATEMVLDLVVKRMLLEESTLTIYPRDSTQNGHYLVVHPSFQLAVFLSQTTNRIERVRLRFLPEADLVSLLQPHEEYQEAQRKQLSERSLKLAEQEMRAQASRLAADHQQRLLRLASRSPAEIKILVFAGTLAAELKDPLPLIQKLEAEFGVLPRSEADWYQEFEYFIETLLAPPAREREFLKDQVEGKLQGIEEIRKETKFEQDPFDLIGFVMGERPLEDLKPDTVYTLRLLRPPPGEKSVQRFVFSKEVLKFIRERHEQKKLAPNFASRLCPIKGGFGS